MTLDRLSQHVLRQLKAKYQGIMDVQRPRWLTSSRWMPKFVMSLPNDPRIIAIDLIPSANIARTIYKEEVAGLKNKHPELRVIVCVLDEGLAQFPEANSVCQKLDCGLQAFTPAFGLQTVLTTDLDKMGSNGTAGELGWFPQEILSKATGLTNLSFFATLDKFCLEMQSIGDSEAAAAILVQQTVDLLFQYYPKCHADVGSFMKLAHFESIIRPKDKGASEHVLHSFRVFLAGCVIINSFYDEFKRSHRRFSLGSGKVSIEYCWLLTAVFHDIGYPWQRSGRLVQAELEDEDVEVSMTGKSSRWIKDHYSQALRILATLGAFVGGGPRGGERWDGGAIADDQAAVLKTEWISLYDSFTSHAVVSAVNMLASIVEQARAADERKNHVFVLAHAVPAALAILLHDWRMWKGAKVWKLFPVDMGIIPLAGLLIFIDTWDDFKRRGPVSPITVEKFTVDPEGVGVTIKWHRGEDYEKDKIKYSAFETALKNNAFHMRIKVNAPGMS